MAVHRNVGKCAFDGRSHEREAIRPAACLGACSICGRGARTALIACQLQRSVGSMVATASLRHP